MCDIKYNMDIGKFSTDSQNNMRRLVCAGDLWNTLRRIKQRSNSSIEEQFASSAHPIQDSFKVLGFATQQNIFSDFQIPRSCPR